MGGLVSQSTGRIKGLLDTHWPLGCGIEHFCDCIEGVRGGVGGSALEGGGESDEDRLEIDNGGDESREAILEIDPPESDDRSKRLVYRSMVKLRETYPITINRLSANFDQSSLIISASLFSDGICRTLVFELQWFSDLDIRVLYRLVKFFLPTKFPVQSSGSLSSALKKCRTYVGALRIDQLRHIESLIKRRK